MSSELVIMEEGDEDRTVTEDDFCTINLKLPPEMEARAADVLSKSSALDEATIKEAIANASPELRADIAGIQLMNEILIFTAQGQGFGFKATLEKLRKRKKCTDQRRETTRRRNEEIDKALELGIARDKIYNYMRENFDTLMRGRGKPHMQEEMMWRSHKSSKKEKTNCNKAT
jgi:hypothetical protein